MCFKPPACRPIRLRVALSAAFQCGFHVVISFATTLLFPHAHSFAMPATLSAAMERLMRFHSLCWLPSRRQCSAGSTVRLLAAPIALLAAIRCLFHNAILFAMPLSAAVQRLLPYAISLAMPVALSAALELLMRFHSLPSFGENPVRDCGSLFFRAPRRAVNFLPGNYAWLRRRAVLLRLRRSGFEFPASSLGWVLLALSRSAALHSLQTAFLFSCEVVCMEPLCAPVGSFLPVPGSVLCFHLH